MKRDRAVIGLAGAALLALLPALGCTTEARRDASEGTAEARKEGSEAAGEVKDAAKDAGREIKDAAQTAGQKAEEAAEGLAPKVDAAKQLADVKMALMADASVDASKINVDAEEATKTIHLKGSVPTTAQKAAAEKIAQDKAQGWKVHNMLTVAK